MDCWLDFHCCVGIERIVSETIEVKEGVEMFELLKKTYLAGLGLATLTKERIEEIVDELVKRGEVAEQDRRKVVDDLLGRAREEQQKLTQKITDVISDLRLPSRERWEDLVRRVENLEKQAQAGGESESQNASSAEND
jgi:polyhydroxyalkanoate synthesis regulator phasin